MRAVLRSSMALLLLLLACGPGAVRADAEDGTLAPLSVVVLVNGEAAGAAPGPVVAPGAALEWGYRVTNTGSVPLWSLYLWHDGLGRGECPQRSLAVGQTVECRASGSAVEGDYGRMVYAWAWDAAGTQAAGTGEAHYSAPPAPTTTTTTTLPPPAPALDLETYVNGEDADAPPGAVVGPGGVVTFRYEVRNTGNVELWGLWVRDEALGTIACPSRYLRPGDLVICEVSRSAALGAHAAGAEAWGWDASGGSVSDGDMHHYTGTAPDPAVDIEAYVEGFDGDSSPGPRVRRPGETITFTYVVANTGGTRLESVQVTDDALGAVACPGQALAVGETMACTATVVARLGQFSSRGRVTAVGAGLTVTDSDPIFYHVRTEPRIHNLVLEVAVNGRDADDAASAPTIRTGSSARFTYNVTYTGNNIVYNVTIQDPRVPASLISCNLRVRTLSAGQSMRCTATVPAVAGPYSALVTVVSWDADGVRVSAQDMVNYYGLS